MAISEDESVRSADKEEPLRGVLRTLAVIQALNVRYGASVAQLAQSTGISRPALYRILETLRGAGYVSFNRRQERYQLTLLVRSLGGGYTDEDRIAELARPLLLDLQKEILWPADLGTFMDGWMWITETTRPASPLTIDRGAVGQRMPVLQTATGRAYLAFCPEDERREILAILKASDEPCNHLARDPVLIAALLDRTRQQGYGERFGEFAPESGAIAVPILMENRVRACLNITFMSRVLTPEQAAEKYLAAMCATAGKVAEAFAADAD